MDAPHSPMTPLSPLEVSGALCARVLHDLTNLLSGIIGNVEFMQRPDIDAENYQKAMQAIGDSAYAAGRLLGQSLPLQHAVSHSTFSFETAELAMCIAESAGMAPGWQVTAPPELVGQVLVEPRWLTSAVMQIARETDTTIGEIQFACGPAVYPVAWEGSNPNLGQPLQLFQINLSYRGDESLFPLAKELVPEKLGLLAASELVRRFKGQIHACTKPPGRQSITILLPLISC